MQQRAWKVTAFLCGIWTVSLLYGEMVAFWVPSMWTCSWPRLPGSSSSSSKMIDEKAYVGDHVKVAILADPQLMDKTSHGLAPKSLVLEILQFYTDIYMRRSFLQTVLPLKPDVVVFLGDYFDGGPLLSDEEWQESLSRFKHIFDLNHRGSSDIPLYYIPGNHDIGYAGVLSRNPKVIGRYEKEFGARNHKFTTGKVEFIAVDAQTLDGKKHGNLTSKSWNFIKNASTGVMSSPRVLLTHIPLYRPNWTPCGLQRSSPIINQRISYSFNDQEILYQNYLTKETSSLLLEFIRPVLVLSGHDHDQCTVTHQTQHGPITEHTVGTLSWQQGNLYPSFMLLSASLAFSNTTKSEGVVSTQVCFLPMQTHIYIWYLSLFVFTILSLLLWPTYGLGCWYHYINFVGSTRRSLSGNILKNGTKEKDEYETCGYEMIWDAEGSMHLVKKDDFKLSSDSGLVGRGNAAVVRPTAKKHKSQEIDASFALEINADVLDGSRKLQPKTNKFKTELLMLRLVRTFPLLMAIAAVNIPLYVMLLFKDWIDK